MGQTAFLLVISVLLQDGRHLSALDTGLWLVPSGVFIVIGAQVGARLHAPDRYDGRGAGRALSSRPQGSPSPRS